MFFFICMFCAILLRIYSISLTRFDCQIFTFASRKRNTNMVKIENICNYYFYRASNRNKDYKITRRLQEIIFKIFKIYIEIDWDALKMFAE